MKQFLRLSAGLLALCMLLCILPAALAQEAASADDVFDTINAAIAVLESRRSAATDVQKVAVAKQAVQSLGYAVDENGSGQFTWYVGDTACVYSTRLRKLAENATTVGAVGDTATPASIDFGSRTSSPGAVDVALIEPYYGIDENFTDAYQTQCSSIAATTGGTYSLYQTDDATIDSIAAALQTSAVVVFDSHGITDYENGDDLTSQANTSYLCLQSGVGLTAADQAAVSGSHGTYQHAMYAGYSQNADNSKMYYYCVDGTAIANHMTSPAPNSLVWNAVCLGMATDGMCTPLRDNGVGIVYGYSQSVYFAGDYAFQETFWDEMKSGTTVSDAISYMKDCNGLWDTCNRQMNWLTIDVARNNYAAFPIVVSAEDEYPGQGNVDALQSVGSTWMLMTPYSVTVNSCDTARGTVSKLGAVITAQSASGFYPAGYSVSPAGAANVVQDGNRFTVTGVTQACTVTIQFEPKTAAVVSFAVPDGAVQAQLDALTGDEVTLPTPGGTPEGGKSYTFLGWTDAAVESTETKPAFYPAGSSCWLSGDRTLYALYEYLDDSAGSTTDFVLKNVNQIEPTDPVVITMRYGITLYALHGGNGAKAAPSAMIVNAADNTIHNPPQALRWNLFNENGNLRISPAGNADTWLYCSNNDNGVRVGTSTGNTFSVNGSYLQNVETRRYLGVYRTNPDWRCYTTTGSISGQVVEFYAAKAGTTKYSTLVSHVWGTGVVTTPATCTLGGVRTYTCALCSQTRTEVIAATGHLDENGDGRCDVCGEGPYFAVSDENAVPGGTVTVNIFMRNNPGICTAILDVSYDSEKLQLLSATDTGLLHGGVFGGTLSEMPYRLYWDQSTDSDCTQSGMLAQLQFRVLQDAAPGETEIVLSYDAADIYNMQQQCVPFALSAGTLSLRSYLPGDADADGALGTKDATVLRRYLAGGWDVTVDETVCDVNADGIVNAKDVTLLRRYLAGGWDVVLR